MVLIVNVTIATKLGNTGNDIIRIYNCIMITHKQLNKTFGTIVVGTSEFFQFPAVYKYLLMYQTNTVLFQGAYSNLLLHQKFSTRI